MIKISATIITFNEEKRLRDCLDSLQGIVDEIVVVDSFSTDNTKAICDQYGARFYQHKFNGFQEQKNIAHQYALHEWVLSLDADELLSTQLRKEILAVKERPTANGYEFSRLNYIKGSPIRYSGWSPDIKLRLVKKDLSKWVGGLVHENLIVEGQVEFLEGKLIHHTYESIHHYLHKVNHYTTLEAKRDYENGKRATIGKLVTRAPLEFVKKYVFKKGFLDGFYGFIVAVISASYVFMKYAKMIDLKEDRNI